MAKAFGCNACMFVAKYKGYRLSEIKIIQGMGLLAEMGGVYFAISGFNGLHADFSIGELVYTKPSCGRGGAFFPEFFMWGNNSIEYVQLLYAHGVSSAHNG